MGRRAKISRLLRAPWPLPDLDHLLRWQVQLVAGLHVECLLEVDHVADDAVAAVLGRAVRIGQQALAQFILAELARPDLAPPEVEALLAGVAVDHRRALTMQRDLVRL